MSMQDIPTTAKVASKTPRPVAPPPSNMSVEHVRYIGESLYGSLWKNDMVEGAKVVKSLITCILNRTRPIPHDFPERMRNAAIGRLMAISEALIVPGMPDIESEQTRGIRELIYRVRDLYMD